MKRASKNQTQILSAPKLFLNSSFKRFGPSLAYELVKKIHVSKSAFLSYIPIKSSQQAR